jgi:hypothetical protein
LLCSAVDFAIADGEPEVSRAIFKWYMDREREVK